MESGNPALRRALFRGVVWTVVPGLVFGAGSLFFIHPPPLELVLAVVLCGPFLAAPLGWLEVQSGRWRDRYLLWMCVAPLLLVAVSSLQLVYVSQLIERASAGEALQRTLHLLERDLPSFLVGAVLTGIPFAMAGYRRTMHMSLGRVLLYWLVASLATCGLVFPLAVGYLATELLNGFSDLLERRALGDGEAALPEDLPFSRVWLLAYLGHPAAMRRLGANAPASPLEVGEWARGLEPAGDEALRRAVLAPIRRLLLEAAPVAGWEPVHAALRAWVDAPGPELAEAAVRELDLARRPVDEREKHLRRLAAVIRSEPWGRKQSLVAAFTRLGDPEALRAEVVAELTDWASEPASTAPGLAGPSQVRTPETDARP